MRLERLMESWLVAAEGADPAVPAGLVECGCASEKESEGIYGRLSLLL